MSDNRKVFISYAREDVEKALQLYHDLKKAGMVPWMDEEDLLPGQNWESVIKREIHESRYFVAVLSSASLGKTGYVQRELKMALDILIEFPDDKIFLIPVRLDECEPRDDRLRKIHCADMFPSYERGLAKVLTVLLPEKKKEQYQQKMESKITLQPNPIVKIPETERDIKDKDRQFHPKKLLDLTHFVYPVAKGSEFIACGRFIASAEQLPGYEIATPNITNRSEVNVAVSELAPESSESPNLIYEKKDESPQKFMGDSMDFAYMLALISRSRSLKLPAGDIWCTGIIDIKNNKYPFLKRVNPIGFDGKLKGFVSDKNPDRLFIVPASNIENHHKALCQEHNVNVTLSGSSRIDIRNLCRNKTVLKVRETDLEILRDFLFQKTSVFSSILKTILS